MQHCSYLGCPLVTSKKVIFPNFCNLLRIFELYLLTYWAFPGGINDPIVLQAALLHDTVEDTETTLDEIEKHFGKTVRE